MALTKVSGSILKDPLNLGEVSIGGTLTYQDVTNVDAIGIGTFRAGIDITGGNLIIPDKIIHSGDTNTSLRFPSADTITAETGGTERLRINSSGLVNIGAGSSASGLSPLLHLHKNASNSSAYLHITNNDTGITNNDGFLLGVNPSGDCLVFNKDSTPMRFATAGVERLRIDAGGGMQLGTSTATASKLTVYGANDAAAIFQGSGTGTGAANGLLVGNNGGTTGLLWNYENGNTLLATNNIERLRITSAGKVGIGTNNPLKQLHVFKSNEHPVMFERGDTSNTIIELKTNGATRGFWGCSTTANFMVYDNDTSDINFIVNQDGNIGIDGQTSPQAKLHIGNYETTQNENQSTVTQYFIDSTRSLKIARCNRGSVSNAGWYDVAVLANSGYSYRCQVSIGGNFTQDVVDIDIQMAYGFTLGNKYSMQIHAKSACAHSNDRITHVRVAEKSNVSYLQVYLQNVNSQTNGKSVLETTCGIYAQNGADNAYPMFAAASGSYSNICTTFPDFGVHASWDITVNSSHVRSYTALTGGSQIYVTAENAGNGSSHGTVGRFTAPMRGLYQVNLNAKAIITPSRNNNILLSMYGSMTYDAQNVWTTNSEVYDPRGAVAGAQGQQGEGNSWYLRMAAYDYFSIDWYRPASTGYTNGGGDIFNISVLKMG